MASRKQTSDQIHGFTIVEMIIVVVIIGVLATIGVVSYGNWRNNLTSAQLKSDLNGAVSAMEAARNFGNGYPTFIPSTFTPSSGVLLVGGGSADGKTYCLIAINNDIIYSRTNTSSDPVAGNCPGGAVMSMVATTMTAN
ncbi:MAG: prepilin-type N-terminal cleavage/methylation domain-containing protein, partial [Candidatus Saccharibacteria bacterium]